MRNVILELISPKLPEKKRIPKWYEKFLIFIGVGISILFVLMILLVFLAISAWAIKYLVGVLR